MSGHAERLRRRADAIGGGATRAARLAVRLGGGTPPRFDDLARVPIWRLHGADEIERIALTAGLLHHRPAIDAELSGARLAPLAVACGEALFDHACDGPPPAPEHCADASAGVPEPEALRALGQVFMARTDDATARALVTRAAVLVEEMRA
jgi:hypothetical protein